MIQITVKVSHWAEGQGVKTRFKNMKSEGVCLTYNSRYFINLELQMQKLWVCIASSEWVKASGLQVWGDEMGHVGAAAQTGHDY